MRAMSSVLQAVRQPVRAVPGMAASDGAGVRLTRMLGTPALPLHDPFLMLDNFHSDAPGDYLAGFPDHPHRGFETVTYILDGRMRHWDNKGHAGVIGPGGVQWMTAGRGLVHSEMPEQQDGLLSGFQLWVNLPARLKLCEPRYQEFSAEEIAVESREAGVQVRVIAGRTSRGTAGPVQDSPVDAHYFDVTLQAGAVFEEPLAPDLSVLIVPIAGAVRTAPDAEAASRGRIVVLGDGDGVRIQAGETEARFLVIAGRPIGEPVARSGPFVMNTRDELIQAMQDFQTGRF